MTRRPRSSGRSGSSSTPKRPCGLSTSRRRRLPDHGGSPFQRPRLNQHANGSCEEKGRNQNSLHAMQCTCWHGTCILATKSLQALRLASDIESLPLPECLPLLLFSVERIQSILQVVCRQAIEELRTWTGSFEKIVEADSAKIQRQYGDFHGLRDKVLLFECPLVLHSSIQYIERCRQIGVSTWIPHDLHMTVRNSECYACREGECGCSQDGLG